MTRAYRELDGPIARLGAKDVPIPYSPSLEAAVLPTHERIAQRISEIACD